MGGHWMGIAGNISASVEGPAMGTAFWFETSPASVCGAAGLCRVQLKMPL